MVRMNNQICKYVSTKQHSLLLLRVVTLEGTHFEKKDGKSIAYKLTRNVHLEKWMFNEGETISVLPHSSKMVEIK